jgi:hypothetical protein
MKIKLNIALILFASLMIFGCKRYDQDYKADFLKNHEKTYPGLASNVHYYPGKLRTILVWSPSPDPTIKNYVISWNNGSDSIVVDASSHNPGDSIKAEVKNLKEYVYSFRIVAKDDAGNASIGQSLDNVRVYGAAYQAALTNRPYNSLSPYWYNNDGSVTLNFTKADTNNVATTVEYTNNAGETQEKNLAPADNAITLNDFKYGTAIKYRSAYVPAKNAVDNFDVTTQETFPTVYTLAEVDKSQMKAVYLPTDVSSAYNWELPYLWDKSTGEPGFHTPGQDFPIWFTIDLGNPTELARLKLWQRTSSLYNYGNPKVFEIWGTNSPNSNGDYSGWTKIASFTSIKPSGLPAGQNSAEDETFAGQGESFTFVPGNVPVRYIRFKILETWGATNYFHALEITLFKPVK